MTGTEQNNDDNSTQNNNNIRFENIIPNVITGAVPVNNEQNVNMQTYNNYILNLLNFYIDPLKRRINELKNQLNIANGANVRLQKQIDESNKKCSVCMDNKVERIFIPCGHACLCDQCYERCQTFNFRNCPVCRTDGQIYKIYIS